MRYRFIRDRKLFLSFNRETGKPAFSLIRVDLGYV